MMGYYDDETRTREAITSDSFMKTGDLATIDSGGFCRIVGRSKDMIIRGGENVFPAELENFLIKMDNVLNVAVIGVPDERMGEEICAWIIPKHVQEITLSQVREHCRGRIAHFKIPKYVVTVAEFPLTVTGKVQKQKLRELWKSIPPKSKL